MQTKAREKYMRAKAHDNSYEFSATQTLTSLSDSNLTGSHLMILTIMNAGERIRTFAGTKPTALEAAPFDHSGTPA